MAALKFPLKVICTHETQHARRIMTTGTYMIIKPNCGITLKYQLSWINMAKWAHNPSFHPSLHFLLVPSLLYFTLYVESLLMRKLNLNHLTLELNGFSVSSFIDNLNTYCTETPPVFNIFWHRQKMLLAVIISISSGKLSPHICIMLCWYVF